MKKIIKIGIMFCSLLILSGCNDKQNLFEGNIQSKTEAIVEIDTKRLEAFEESEVGDNVAMVGIANNLPGNIFYKSIELHTDRLPLGISVFYDKNGIEEEAVSEFLKDYRRVAYRNARETFRLVPNLVYVNYNFTSLGGEKIHFKREDIISENCDGLRVLELDSYKGVGNFKLGMKKEEVQNIANEYRGKGFSEMKTPVDFEKVKGKKAQDYGMFVVFL